MWCEGFCGVFVNIFLIIAVVLGLHYVYLLWNSDYWKKRGVFCPDSKALMGNLPGQVNGKRNIMYDLDDLYQEYKDKFGYIGIFNFRQPRLLVFDPEIIKAFMIKYFKNFQGTEFYGRIDRDSDPLFGNHPFFQVGDEWKRKRVELSPAFTSLRIKAIFPVLQEVRSKMLDYIRQEIRKPGFEGFDAKDLAARYTIATVSNSIYNVDAKSFIEEKNELMEKGQEFLLPSKKVMITLMLSTVYPFLGKFFKISFSKPGATEFFLELMNKAIRYREKSNVKRVDYLDHLTQLKNKKDISDLDLASLGASFLVDGFETSSSAIAGALKELAGNHKAQQKLRDEINNLLPNEEDFTYDNIMNLPYLDQVWHESLRLLHSSLTHLTRVCNEPVEVDLPKDKKLFFDKGSMIYFPLTSIHMDPEYYPSPKEFNPERFAPEYGGVKAFIDRGIYLPFGIGPRVCPGSRFALAQSKVAIATIVKNFEMTISHKSPKEYVIHPQAFLVSLVGCSLEFKEIVQN